MSRPFVLDFAHATLGQSVPHLDDPEWIADRRQMYGDDWPEVSLLLEALLQYGTGYVDVHPQNISLRR
ncbi:MAG: hypothetical protein ACF8TS_17825 [Maioricimonas sp. JB049]